MFGHDIDSNRVVHVVDGDLPLKFFVEDSSHVRRTPLRKMIRAWDSALQKTARLSIARSLGLRSVEARLLNVLTIAAEITP